MSDPDVLVIGAGMAGLGAARVLEDAGRRVTVIEGRGRIGGRTHTSHLWPDLPVDMGASWIHGTRGNPLTALASELGLKVTPTTYGRSATRDDRGRAVDFDAATERAMRLVWKARRRVADGDRDVSLQTAIEALPDWRSLSALDRRIARLAINTRIEHEYAGDWAALSAWHFDDGKDLPGPEAVVTPGFGAMAHHLARGLDIRLSEPVLRIAPRATGVEVTTTLGRHLAEHAIVTLPLGVLRSGRVAFAEPLAPARQRAIDSLGMGLLNKCVLRFDRVFWPPEVDWIDFLGPRETLWADWTSYLRATGQPLLVGFNAARMADEVEGWDDRTCAASAVAALRAMFGTSVPDPSGHQISRWREDPFALGAYSFQAVGTQGKDRAALSGTDWDGRLSFAGEAASRDHPATVHGALLSGQAAATALPDGAHALRRPARPDLPPADVPGTVRPRKTGMGTSRRRQVGASGRAPDRAPVATLERKPAMTVEILRITPQNAGCLAHVDPEIFDDILDPERVAAFAANETHLLVAARDEGLVVGQIRAILHLQPDGSTQLYIDNLGVAPSHQRRGIARRLLQEALLWGKDRGCAEAWVATEPDNDAARGLYSGFMTEPEETMAYFQIAIS